MGFLPLLFILWKNPATLDTSVKNGIQLYQRKKKIKKKMKGCLFFFKEWNGLCSQRLFLFHKFIRTWPSYDGKSYNLLYKLCTNARKKAKQHLLQNKLTLLRHIVITKLYWILNNNWCAWIRFKRAKHMLNFSASMRVWFNY